MYQGQINVRYAKSLFQLAIERDLVDEMKDDIQLVLETFQENDNLETIMSYPVMKTSKKNQIIKGIFNEKINEYSLSFLLLIIKNKREKHIKNICTDFLDLYAEHKEIKRALITTAFNLNRTQAENIRKSIEKKFKSTIELETKVDKSLIGGVIIQVDDKQIDLSVARQIQDLRTSFLDIDFNNRKRK